MQNCIYLNKRINAVMIVEEGSYEEKKAIKIAGSRRELICEDCCSPVFLRICKEKTSHFVHWHNQDNICSYSEYSMKETEHHRKCKVILSKYFRNLYPEENIETEFKAINNRRSDIYIDFKDGNKLAIDLHKNNLSASKWYNKHSDYKNAGINDIWIICSKPEEGKEKYLPFFEQIALNESIDGIALFLDANSSKVTLMKKVSYIEPIKRIEQCDLFHRTYKLDEIKILPDGRIDCSFQNEFSDYEKNFISKLESKNRIYELNTIQKVSEHNDNLKFGQASFFGEQQIQNSKKTKNSLFKYNEPGVQQQPITPKKNNYVKYSFDKKKVGDIMKAYMRRVLNGEADNIKKLVEMLHRSPDYYFVFKEVQQEYNNSGNKSMSRICEGILKSAGMED